ncbi:hypothetical protein D3C85_792970 [compost metagenome]
MNIGRVQLARLVSIDFHLLHLRVITRRQHMERFDVGPASASRDIALYLDFTRPGQVIFDTKLRRYVPTASFTPVYKHALGLPSSKEEAEQLHKMLCSLFGVPTYCLQEK